MYKKILKHSKKLFAKTHDDASLSAAQSDLQSYLAHHKKKQVMITEISLFSAVKIIGVLLSLFLLWQFVIATSSILISLFFAIFLASAFSPLVNYLEKKNIPRALAILITLVCVFVFLGVLISSILPPLINQIITLGEWIVDQLRLVYNGDFSQIPAIFQQFGEQAQKMLQDLDTYLRSLRNDQEAQQGLFQVITDNFSQFEPWRNGVITVITGLFSSIASFLIVLVMTFFLLFEKESIFAFILKFFPKSLQNYCSIKAEQMQGKISGWIHGQMILFLFMGGITWAFFSLLGIEYALTIGFVAGVAEFIPYLGPLITLAVGAPLAFGQGFEVGMIVLVFFGIMQFVEGNILIPIVMEKAVGVSGIVAILAMLIGFTFLDIRGAIIAIPLAAIIGIFIEDFQNRKSDDEHNP